MKPPETVIEYSGQTLTQPELPPPHENAELTPPTGLKHTDGGLFAPNQIYGEIPSVEDQAEIAKHKQTIQDQAKARENLPPVENLTEINRILDNPPPTGEQLQSTWQRLKKLIRGEQKPLEELPPSAVAQKLDEAEKTFDRLTNPRPVDDVAREIANEITQSIQNPALSDEEVQKLVSDYMAARPNMLGDIAAIQNRVVDRVLNKLTVKRLQPQVNLGFIKKVSTDPEKNIPVIPKTRPAEVPVPIGSSGRTEPVHQQVAEAPQVPERPQVNVQTAANAILARARTDVPRRIETEETRLFRERNVNNPDAVAPLHEETYDEMITRNIDTYLMNQRDGTASPQTRAAIEALVREGLHVSQERSVQQAAAAPSPEPPNPPDKPSEIPKAPVLSDYLTKLSRDLALTAQGELARGNSEPVNSIVEKQIAIYEHVNGPLNQSNRDALAHEIQIRVQELQRRHKDAAAQRNPQPIASPPIAEVNPSIPKKKGLIRSWLDIMTGKS